MRAPIFLFAVIALFGSDCAAAQPVTPIKTSDFPISDGQGVTTVQDPSAPVSFQLPAGWILVGGVRWGNHETTLSVLDTASGTTASVYYQYPIQSVIPANLDAALAAGMEAKVRQRQDREGLKDYHVRTGSPQTSVVDGRPALSFIGDFTAPRSGLPMSEYLLRVLGANTKAEFFVKLPAATDLTSFANRFDSIAQTLRMP
jgi:hypothetical protein